MNRYTITYEVSRVILLASEAKLRLERGRRRQGRSPARKCGPVATNHLKKLTVVARLVSLNSGNSPEALFPDWPVRLTPMALGSTGW